MLEKQEEHLFLLARQENVAQQKMCALILSKCASVQNGSHCPRNARIFVSLGWLKQKNLQEGEMKEMHFYS